MFNWLKSHKIITLLVLATVVFGGYKYYKSKQLSYEEYVVTRQNMQETFELSGKVASDRSATLRFSAGGLVTYLGAKEGDRVKKWQTLASIDTRQLQKTLEQKLNLYAIERGEFDQGRDDYDANIRTGNIDQELRRLLEKNQYQLDNTVKDVEYQDLSLKLSRLSTPISGVLTHAPIDVSNVQVLATDTWVVVDPDSLYFSADLDETDLKRVVLGQKVIITLDAYPDKNITSTIKSIAYSPKETTSGTTYEVTLALPPDLVSDLRLGLNGTAAIITAEKADILSLPSSALTIKDGKYLVLIKSGKKYVEKEVSTGIENEGFVEIKSGLGESDQVYVKK